ncbi:MAG: hypothetical protein HYU66_05850, partial [Armatimonadetes bacterium]|nr:hypothetical protein [Armatimonadota bacterium]
RFWQVTAGDKVLWEEDMALDRAAGKAWTTIDLGGVAKPGEELVLRLRGTDKRGVYDYSTVAYVGPARLVEQ